MSAPKSDTDGNQETSLGFPIKVLALAAYLVPPVSGLFIACLEHQSRYCRVHGWQCVIVTMIFVPFLVAALALDSWAESHVAEIAAWTAFLFLQGLLCGRAWRGASRLGGFLPVIGSWSEAWADRCCGEIVYEAVEVDESPSLDELEMEELGELDELAS